MNEILTMTQKQEHRLMEWREEWLQIGLSCEPADRPGAEDALRRLYKTQGISEPRTILWAQSPWQASIMSALLDNKNQLGGQL